MDKCEGLPESCAERAGLLKALEIYHEQQVACRTPLPHGDIDEVDPPVELGYEVPNEETTTEREAYALKLQVVTMLKRWKETTQA